MARAYLRGPSPTQPNGNAEMGGRHISEQARSVKALYEQSLPGSRSSAGRVHGRSPTFIATSHLGMTGRQEYASLRGIAARRPASGRHQEPNPAGAAQWARCVCYVKDALARQPTPKNNQIAEQLPHLCQPASLAKLPRGYPASAYSCARHRREHSPRGPIESFVG